MKKYLIIAIAPLLMADFSTEVHAQTTTTTVSPTGDYTYTPPANANYNVATSGTGNFQIAGVNVGALATVVPGTNVATAASVAANAANGLVQLNGSDLIPFPLIPSGTTSSTVAVGNDGRITGANAARNIYFAIRTDGLTGSGTPNDPYDGSSANFDNNLALVTFPAKVILGPGTFITGIGIHIPSGELCGSGMSRTTIQLAAGTMNGTSTVLGTDPNSTKAHLVMIQMSTAANGTLNSNSTYIHDLTIDGNLVNNSTFSGGGIGLTINLLGMGNGNNSIVQRCQFLGYGSIGTAGENFPVQVFGTNINNLVEDCQFEAPPAITANLTTLLASGANTFGIVFRHNYFSPMTGGGTNQASGIHTVTCESANWEIVDNYFDGVAGTSNSISIYMDTGTYGSGLISENVFYNAFGFYFRGTGNGAQQIKVERNLLYSTVAQKFTYCDGKLSGIDINNNMIQTNGTSFDVIGLNDIASGSSVSVRNNSINVASGTRFLFYNSTNTNLIFGGNHNFTDGSIPLAVDSSNSLTTPDGTGIAANIIPVQFIQTANAGPSGTTTETALTGTGVGTLTIPAKRLATGTTISYKLSGYLATSGTPTLNIKIKLGSTVYSTTGAQTLTAITGNGLFTLTGEITIRTNGASGTAIGQGMLMYYTGAAGLQGIQATPATSTTAIDTTTSQAFSVTATLGTATSNSVTCTNCTLELLN